MDYERDHSRELERGTGILQSVDRRTNERELEKASSMQSKSRGISHKTILRHEME
jgi:hypothetical protein